MTSAGWRGELKLRYHRRGPRTVAFDAHSGPLRVLKPLYPEGEGVCHHVLVHPPGGVVGGDELQVQVDAEAGSHALLTTPGATRFYRSDGALARQHTRLRVAEGARLEWLPLETIAFSGCQASNCVTAELAPGAEMMGWDVLALGLAAAGQPFVAGTFSQQLELPGQWLERGRIAASDHTLLQGPLGWAGHTVSATLWFAAGAALPVARRSALVDAARELLPAPALAAASVSVSACAGVRAGVRAGVSAVQPGVVVLRVLAGRVEPVMQLCAAVRAAWRRLAWGLAAEPPRVWRT